jgi:type IV secretion system protein VirB11
MRHYLGPVMGFFADPEVEEVYVNPSGQVWTDRRGRGRTREPVALRRGAVRAFLNTVADRKRETLSSRVEQVQAQLPAAYFGGARLQGFLPQIVPSACFVIRKRPSRIYALGEYVENGMMTAKERRMIERAVRRRQNVLVAGGTKSGKTTLVNAILDEMVRQGPGERFVILEDTPELQCRAEDVLQMETSLTIGLQDLVKLTLRATPDRIIIGEVRDGAAYHLMDAWTTGHPGGAGTVHATTARGALRRMERLARQAARVEQRTLVAESIDVVVVIAFERGRRTVTDIALVQDDLSPGGAFVLERPAGGPSERGPLERSSSKRGPFEQGIGGNRAADRSP